jgi:hypothetical protein
LPSISEIALTIAPPWPAIFSSKTGPIPALVGLRKRSIRWHVELYSFVVDVLRKRLHNLFESRLPVQTLEHPGVEAALETVTTVQSRLYGRRNPVRAISRRMTMALSNDGLALLP